MSSWDFSRLENDLATMNNERMQLYNANFTLKQQANEQYLRISGLEEQIRSHQTTHNQLLESINEKIETIGTLHAGIQSRQEGHAAEMSRLQQTHNIKIAKLGEIVGELKNENKILQQITGSNQEKILELQEQLVIMQRRATALEKENKDLQGAPVMYSLEIFYYDPKEAEYKKIGKTKAVKAIEISTLDDLNHIARAPIRTKFSLMKTRIKTVILVQSPMMRGGLYQIEKQEFEDWVAAVRGAGHEKVNARCRYVVYREEDASALVEFKIRGLNEADL